MRIEFTAYGCGCDLASGSCSSSFTPDYIQSYRSQCSELTRAELDMAPLGQLAAFVNTSTHTAHSTKHRHAPSCRVNGPTCSTGMVVRECVERLSSFYIRCQVWLQYCVCLQCVSSPHHQAAYSTFCSIWRRVVPQIIVTKPMSDLCWICQSNSTAIM